MRALFLDIDGVLHPADASALAETGSFCWFDSLATILAPHPNVFVVVHSSWRYSYTPKEIGELMGVLKDRYVGVTPPGQRYEAIKWWLSQNRSVIDYRILDDDPNDFGVPPPTELIICHPLTGVAAPTVQAQLRAWLEV